LVIIDWIFIISKSGLVGESGIEETKEGFVFEGVLPSRYAIIKLESLLISIGGLQIEGITSRQPIEETKLLSDIGLHSHKHPPIRHENPNVGRIEDEEWEFCVEDVGVYLLDLDRLKHLPLVPTKVFDLGCLLEKKHFIGQCDQFFHSRQEHGLHGFHGSMIEDEAKFQQEEFWLKKDGILSDEVTKVFPQLVSLVEQRDEEVTIPLFIGTCIEPLARRSHFQLWDARENSFGNLGSLDIAQPLPDLLLEIFVLVSSLMVNWSVS